MFKTNFLFQFASLSKPERYEILIVIMEIIMSLLVSYKIANAFGWFYYEFDITINSFILFITSGTILVVLLFGIAGYLLIDHAIGFFAWIFSSPFVKDFDSHLNNLCEFKILSKNDNGKIIKSKNYHEYETVLKMIDSDEKVMRIAKSIASIIFFIIFLLFSYGVTDFRITIPLMLIWLYFFVNYVFITRLYREILIHRGDVKCKLKQDESY